MHYSVLNWNGLEWGLCPVSNWIGWLNVQIRCSENLLNLFFYKLTKKIAITINLFINYYASC